MDLFQEKIKVFGLNQTFPEYAGGNDAEKASSFLREKFLDMNPPGFRNSRSVSLFRFFCFFIFLFFLYKNKRDILIFFLISRDTHVLYHNYIQR
jgi:hypothetical protein